MNINNIINESILEKLFNWLVKYPALKKSSKIKKGVDDLNKSISKLEKQINAELKLYNPKSKKIKVKPYKLKDFV